MPGAQESSAVFGKVIIDDGNIGQLQRKDRDYLLGLSYGYESRKWYRWASLRHRFNSNTENGVERPDLWLVDFVIGIRPTPTGYLEPDWVWMLELNGELAQNTSNVSGNVELRTGGDQWFASPGLMWIYRNMAIKAGVQLPVYDDLAEDQDPDDYRAKLELEWHF